MSKDEDELTCASIAKDIGDTAREISKWPKGLKQFAIAGTIGGMLYIATHINKKEEYGEAKHWNSDEVRSSVYGSGSSGTKLNSTENSNSEGLAGIIQEFYASDLENTINLAGTMHDVGGMAAAVAIGGSRYLGVPGLVGAYGVMMVPEIVNYVNDSYNFSEFSGEAGRDILCLLGAYGLGKVIGLFSHERKVQRTSNEVKKTSTKTNEKKWTPWYERD